MLTFGKSNAKLDALEKATGRKVFTFSLLSGHTCPYAKECLSKAVLQSDGSRRIVDGPDTQFRCFSASQEVQYKNVYESRQNNFNALRSADDMVSLIDSELPKNAGIIRIHVGGDFFNQPYFDAWLNVARNNPDIVFYAYTKSLPFWLRRRRMVNNTPNFLLTASAGGRCDKKIAQRKLRFAKVVFSKQEAQDLGLEIDHDDTHAANPELKNDSFALLLHGTQPKGSEASQALKKLAGEGSYSRKK